MDELSSRYLDSFNSIEKWLRSYARESERLDFPALVDLVAASSAAVRHRAAKLKELNRFRNFVVHQYSRNSGLAVPTKIATDAIESLQRELLSPTPLVSVATRPVASCRPNDLIGGAVRQMRDGVFSQIPVWDGERCVGLLTAETIARWLAADLQANEGLVEAKPVSEVMSHQESSDNHAFLSRSSTTDDGIAAFEAALKRGSRLEAILITEKGLPTEGFLGIVTIHDIPRLSPHADT